MKKAFISTLGCKVNQFESASFKTGFEERGMEITGNIDEADIIIINTCAVTSKASAQSRREIRKAARLNRKAPIVVTGCHAQLAADELKLLPEIDPGRLCLIGNDRKDTLVPHILKNKTTDLISADMNMATDVCRLPVKHFGSRTRAYLRVQDGCNSFCSYCIVPFTRGRNRSLPQREVLHQAALYAKAGHKEVVITGIHVGQYGRDLDESCDITSIMEKLCLAHPAIRFRLSSIEPLEINENLLTLMSELGNFMPHLHIPLQSGDNDILRRMNRRYSREQFISIIKTCRTKIPEAAIGIDVLVGFPGEDPEQFNNTRDLIEQMDCTYLHVFPYSKRSGTQAATFMNQVNKHEKQKRVQELRALGESKKAIFYKQHIGTCRSVLLEGERSPCGKLKGFTDNYIPVLVDAEDTRMNTIAIVKLNGLSNGTVEAHIVSDI